MCHFYHLPQTLHYHFEFVACLSPPPTCMFQIRHGRAPFAFADPLSGWEDKNGTLLEVPCWGPLSPVIRPTTILFLLLPNPTQFFSLLFWVEMLHQQTAGDDETLNRTSSEKKCRSKHSGQSALSVICLPASSFNADLSRKRRGQIEYTYLRATGIFFPLGRTPDLCIFPY